MIAAAGDQQLFRGFNFFEGQEVSPQMKPDHCPIGDRIERNLDVGEFLIRVPGFPKFVVKGVGQDHSHKIVAPQVLREFHTRPSILEQGEGLRIGGPPRQEAYGTDATMKQSVPIDVGETVVWGDTGQMRRVERCREPLRGGIVGLADHANFAVGPGLTGGPFDGVIEIGLFLG
jgi:hypothetical protein